MKTAKVFTRDNPCTKIDLHNAFWDGDDYRSKPVVEAKMMIGDNAPKYLLKNGYIKQVTLGGVDMYIPTPAGKEWLRIGLARFLELHPGRAGEVAGKAPRTLRKRLIRPR